VAGLIGYISLKEKNKHVAFGLLLGIGLLLFFAGIFFGLKYRRMAKTKEQRADEDEPTVTTKTGKTKLNQTDDNRTEP